jgi:hypothetical protein
MDPVKLAFAAAALTLPAVAAAPVAQAAPPVIETFVIDDTFEDTEVSEACGVEVVTRVTGHSKVRTFTSRGDVLQETFTINLKYTLTAGENTYVLRDVGSDHIMVRPDGTVTLSIAGQIPFDFTGVLVIDLATGEVLHEPTHFTGDEIDRVCEVLTA